MLILFGSTFALILCDANFVKRGEAHIKNLLVQILLGVFTAALGGVLQWLLWHWLEPNHFIFFYLAVILSTSLGGLFSGLASTFSSVFIATYIFFSPSFSFTFDKFYKPLPFVIFIVTGIAVSFVISKMQRRTQILATKKACLKADQDRARFLENMVTGFMHGEMIYDEKGNPKDFIYKGINSSFERLTGLNPDVVGKKVSEVIPQLKSTNPEIFELYGRVGKGGPAESIQLFVPELKNWFSIKAYYYEEKNQFAAMYECITKEKEAEQALKDSEERFRFIIEQSPLSIQILDTSGRTIKVSKSYEKLWGVSFYDLREYNMLKDEQLDRMGMLSSIKKAFAGDVVELPLVEYDAAATLGKGYKRMISATAYPIKDSLGRVRNVILIHEDVTEKEKAKAAIIEAKEAAENTARLKSRFLDIAAHELRTPVTAFSLIVQLAEKQLAQGQPVDQATLARLRLQAQRISRLVVDLLDVSRLERSGMNLQKEIKDIVSLVNECINDFKMSTPSRNVEFVRPECVINVNVDPVRIHQVISNLLDNAAKYTPESSLVEVSVEKKSDVVRVSVRDTGPGIKPEDQGSLFTPFARGHAEVTTRSGGLGLGLYICRGIVELHGGTVGAESVVGSGSTFYFELPLHGGK